GTWRAGAGRAKAESAEGARRGRGEAAGPAPGGLPARWVIHAARWERGGPTPAETTRRATASTLARADELRATSLALVAFGTGVGGFPLEEAARIEVDEVRRHLEGDTGLERVIFAVRGADAEEAFRTAMSQAG